MRLVITVLYLLLFAVPWEARAERVPTILLFGDSIVAGYGLAANEAIPAQLEAILHQKGHKVKVASGGVSGDTTSGGRSRLEWTLKQFSPDVTVLALGGNDVLRGIPVQVTRENMDAMLKQLASQPGKAVLSRVQAPPNLGPDYQKRFDGIYTGLAKKYGVPLYPFLLEGVFGNPELMQPDGIHPNAKGAKVIAGKLADFLAERFLR